MGRWLLRGAAALGVLVAALAAFYVFLPEQAIQAGVWAERTRSGLAPATVEVDGHTVAYTQGGDGEDLLLIHGFGADKENWTRVARFLTPHFRVTAIDLPGFGESDHPPNARYRITDQVDRVRAIVLALGLERPHLGGNSMGGQISAAYAARFPDDVASLWLLAPGGIATGKPSEMARRIADGQRIMLVSSTESEYEELLAFVTERRPFIPPLFRRHLARRAVANRDHLASIFKELRYESVPLENRVNGLATPTRIVWGEQDRVLHPSGAGVLQMLMPNASVKTMPGIGHLPMVEAPREVAEDYLEWRASLQ